MSFGVLSCLNLQWSSTEKTYLDLSVETISSTIPEEINKVMVGLEKFDVRVAKILLANSRHNPRERFAVLDIGKPGHRRQTLCLYTKSLRNNRLGNCKAGLRSLDH